MLDLREIGFLALTTTKICLWLGLRCNSLFLHCVSGVSFRVLLFRCGTTELRIIIIVNYFNPFLSGHSAGISCREPFDCHCVLCPKEAILSKINIIQT